jgi:hypothetical protein
MISRRRISESLVGTRVLTRTSRSERVTGIERALSARELAGAAVSTEVNASRSCSRSPSLTTVPRGFPPLQACRGHAWAARYGRRAVNVRVLYIVRATPPRVTFACAAGVAAGVWRGAELPVPRQHLDVEWDILGSLHWGVSAVPATEATDFVGSLDEAVVIRGRIELAADENSVVTIKVGGGLVLTEIVDLPTRSAGVWVELRGVKVDLYPTGI